MTWLYKFLALSPGDRARLLEGTLALPLIVLLLPRLGVDRLLRILTRFVRPSSSARFQPEVCAPQIAARFRSVQKHAPVKGNCLSQSITLWWLLRREGIAADLRIGVRKLEDGLDAHAWVEYAGRPLNDPTAAYRYAAFDRPLLPRAPR